MNIPPVTYQKLTTTERIRATIAAESRNDLEEVGRLVSTCPKKTYVQPDAAFSDTMTLLSSLALAVESDLRGLALDWCLERQAAGEDLANTVFERMEIESEMASIAAGWRTVLEEMGIDFEEFTKTAPPRHAMVRSLLNSNTDAVPELAAGIADTFRAMIKAA